MEAQEVGQVCRGHHWVWFWISGAESAGMVSLRDALGQNKESLLYLQPVDRRNFLSSRETPKSKWAKYTQESKGKLAFIERPRWACMTLKPPVLGNSDMRSCNPSLSWRFHPTRKTYRGAWSYSHAFLTSHKHRKRRSGKSLQFI